MEKINELILVSYLVIIFGILSFFIFSFINTLLTIIINIIVLFIFVLVYYTYLERYFSRM
jgi:hypothetical protein